MLVNMADTFMVAKLGDVPLAAVSFAGNLSVPFMFFGIGSAATTTPLIGRRLGRGDTEAIAQIIAHARRFNWLVVLAQLVILAALDILMPFMGQPDEVISIAQTFLPIYAASLIGQQMFVCTRTIIEGMQDTTTPMIVGLACNILNIALNIPLIFGFGNFDGLGPHGAAISTLACRTLMWLVMENILRRRLRKLNIAPRPANSHNLTLRLLKIGLPSGAQAFIECIGFAMGGIMMGWISTQAISAHQVVNAFTSTTFLMVSGLATAITIKVSLASGSNDKTAARHYALTGIALGALFMVATAALYALGRQYIPSLIITNPETLAIASSIMLVGSAFQIFDGLQVTALGALRGFADFAYPARVAAVSYALTCIPVGYFCAFILNLGPAGVWCGFTAGLALAATLLLWRLRKKFLVD